MSGTHDSTVVVVTQRSWVARELPANTLGVVAASEPGLFWPAVAAGPDVAWWMPIEFATRLHCEDAGPALSAPGPGWLPAVPVELSGRVVTSCRVTDLGHLPRTGVFWCKPAEAKIERSPVAGALLRKWRRWICTPIRGCSGHRPDWTCPSSSAAMCWRRKCSR